MARQSRGMSQLELADKLGISQAVVSKHETGIKVPDDEQVKAYAETLGYTADFFYLGEQMFNATGCKKRWQGEGTCDE